MAKTIGGEQIMKKCVITVVGKDTVGIIAKVCEYLAGANVNILDISQTIFTVDHKAHLLFFTYCHIEIRWNVIIAL